MNHGGGLRNVSHRSFDHEVSSRVVLFASREVAHVVAHTIRKTVNLYTCSSLDPIIESFKVKEQNWDFKI